MTQSQLISSQIFETIANEAMTGLMVFQSKSGECCFLNTIAKEALEIDPNLKPSSFRIENFYYGESRNGYKSFRQDLLSLEGNISDVILQKTNGQIIITDMGLKTIHFEEESFLLVMFQDMTLQKKLQREISSKQKEIQSAYEEMRAQNQQLKALDLAKNRFIALTTHELRTPLSALYAASEILINKMYDSAEQQDQFTRMIYEEAQHLMEIVNDILDFSKIQAGKLEFYIGQRDVAKLGKQCLDKFRPLANEKKLNLKIEVIGETTAYFDSLRLNQVVQNVLSNAIKFTRPETLVLMKVESKGDFVQISIADQGIGIPDSHSNKVFDEFETVENIRSHQKGTGLGMPISKRLTESMGGKIHFNSVQNVGTTFYIEVPTTKVLDPSFYRERPDDLGDLAA